MITRLELTNFLVFKHLEIDFSHQINVIIGENGTGKTQLMKAAYALCMGNHLEGTTRSSKSHLQTALASKLVRLFMPLDGRLGRLCRRGASEDAQLEANFDLDKKLSIGFSNRAEKSAKILENENYEKYNHKPIFIPTKEVLSLIRGISATDSDQETIQQVFDDTYLDLCNLLLQSSTTDVEERIDSEPRFGSIFPAIAKAIGGRYEFLENKFRFEEGEYKERRAKNQNEYGDKIETIFVAIKGSEVSNNMTAEGFRKIGILQQLLANKALNPGISGSLFWDEPECNINPKLIKLLVEILLELSHNGQQVILATHDYVVLKWFDLLTDKRKHSVRFHSLYRHPESGELGIERADDYKQLNVNAIASTFSDLYDSEIERSLGGRNK